MFFAWHHTGDKAFAEAALQIYFLVRERVNDPPAG
jgi:hypothetical protein